MSSVILSEPQLDAFIAQYPVLNRTQVLHAIVLHGPDRLRVEAELKRLVAKLQPDTPKQA
jgi:hypothetical protein